MSKPTTLVGRWVNRSYGDYYKSGQIILSLGTEHHLIKWQAKEGCGPPITELLCNDDLCSNESREQFVVFFESEKELDAWMKWMNDPTDDKKPRIVSLRKDDP